MAEPSPGFEGFLIGGVVSGGLAYLMMLAESTACQKWQVANPVTEANLAVVTGQQPIYCTHGVILAYGAGAVAGYLAGGLPGLFGSLVADGVLALIALGEIH